MHLYEAVDLGSPRASLELVEWGPTQNLVVQTTYPNYYAWCGMTSTTAPLGCPFGVPGLFTIYSQNYNLIAAASMMIAIPTLAVYIALQKQFISGLTLGANKG